jgi:hypothetical protein
MSLAYRGPWPPLSTHGYASCAGHRVAGAQGGGHGGTHIAFGGQQIGCTMFAPVWAIGQMDLIAQGGGQGGQVVVAVSVVLVVVPVVVLVVLVVVAGSQGDGVGGQAGTGVCAVVVVVVVVVVPVVGVPVGVGHGGGTQSDGSSFNGHV